MLEISRMQDMAQCARGAVKRRERVPSIVLFLCLALAGSLAVEAAHARHVGVYAAPPGGSLHPGIFPIPSNVAGFEVDLYLMAEAGEATQIGIICESGNGQETCGFELHLQAGGDLKIRQFAPEAGNEVVHSAIDPTDGETEMKITGINVSSAPRTPPVQMRIGKLTVDTLGSTSDGYIHVASGKRVAADLSLESIQEQSVMVAPEPGMAALVLAGLAGLAALGRIRTHR